MDRRKDGAHSNMAAIVKVCLRDSQKRQTNQTGPKESSLNGVRVMCVYLGGSEDGRCQHFFFRVPISICIISIPHEQQRKEGDARTKNQIDTGTMVA